MGGYAGGCVYRSVSNGVWVWVCMRGGSVSRSVRFQSRVWVGTWGADRGCTQRSKALKRLHRRRRPKPPPPSPPGALSVLPTRIQVGVQEQERCGGDADAGHHE